MFSKVVELYRALGRPSVSNASFVATGTFPPETIALINEVDQLPDHFGFFSEKDISGGSVDVEFMLPESEAGRFHATMADFIASTPSLNFGEIPKNFYISDIDYAFGDALIPSVIQSLFDLCRLVRSLSLLASEYKHEDEAKVGENRLFFVLAADGKSPAKTLAITVRLDERLLKFPLPHLKLLEVMVSEGVKNEIHIEERRTIMRLAIADTLAIPDEKPDMFPYLVSHWREVLSKYRHNVLAFVNQYSFEKVRKEIATAEIDHATKLSAVLGDIAGKLLALPISFAAVIALRKASSREEFWVIFVGLVVVSIIFIGILLNQWLQVRRLRGSFDIIFGQYDEAAFPKKLRTPIKTARQNINVQYRILGGTFVVFGVLALLPASAAVYVWTDALPISLIDACILLVKNPTK
jgi:hypothetical protein